MEKREALYGRLNKWLLVAFIAINYGMGIWNVVRGDTFHYVLAFSSVLFVPVVWLFYKLFKLKPVNQLNTIIFAFIFLAYTIGEVLAGYYWIPHFDKVCHALSGTFTGILGIIMYYVLKPGRRMERGDFAACTVFMLCFAMAIAGMWEIGEFTISLVTDLDPQWVEGTGVTDTMTDMIACLIGALALIPSLTIFYKKNRADVIMGAVESFCELNLNSGK